MIITEQQAAMLIIQLSALGQADLTGTDEETLTTLAFLLEQALENVKKAARIGATDAASA